MNFFTNNSTIDNTTKIEYILIHNILLLVKAMKVVIGLGIKNSPVIL